MLDARVARQPHGYHRQALHGWVQLGELCDGAVQHLSVINPCTQHCLCVDLDALRGELLQLRQDGGRMPMIEQLASDTVIGRVDRNIERRQALIADARPVGSFEIREREEVAPEERIPVVVVEDIQARTQARR